MKIKHKLTIDFYHGFGREVGLELGTNNIPTVTMRPSHLAVNAPIVGNLII